MNPEPTRRTFLKQTTETAAVLAAATATGGVHAFGAEKPATVRLGDHRLRRHHDACTSKGWSSGARRCRSPGCAMSIRAQIDKMAGTSRATSSPPPPKRTARYEDVIDDKDVDACIIATPHHWHAPIALARDAGRQGRLHRKADLARLQRRAADHRRRQEIRPRRAAGEPDAEQPRHRKGRPTAQGRDHRRSESGPRLDGRDARRSRSRCPTAMPPAGVDYDRWLGPAPKRPFNPHRFHQTWRMFRDYGNGEIGDDGIHDLDMAAWGLGIDTLPKQITARGGRMMLDGHASEYPGQHERDVRVSRRPAADLRELSVHGLRPARVRQRQRVLRHRGLHDLLAPGPSACSWARRARRARPKEKLRGQTGYPEHMADFLDAVRNRTPTRTRRNRPSQFAWSIWAKSPSARAAGSTSTPRPSDSSTATKPTAC